MLARLGERVSLSLTGYFFLSPTFQRTVKHIVDKTYLNVLCTPVPEEFLDQNVVYFLRNTKGIFLVCVRECGCVCTWVCTCEILNFYTFLRTQLPPAPEQPILITRGFHFVNSPTRSRFHNPQINPCHALRSFVDMHSIGKYLIFFF